MSRTFFPQQEVQEVVGVDHAHFGLYLRTPQGGVDVPGTLALLSLPQLGEAAAHLTAVGRYTHTHTTVRELATHTHPNTHTASHPMM